jgi:carbonic anhydrase/acetyltransferase-like protein (isoleucine patch superfamily)
MAIYRLEQREPTLPEGFFWVAESAAVIGSVVIGEEVAIWFGAVLRGDNETITVGAGTNIQENAVLHTDDGYPLTIGENCTIGHKAMLHGCTIGANSLIGMGATVLNGAVIGRNCLIGAGALITEGKVIPDNSLVIGAPGKVVRELGADAEAMLAESARHYVENARRFSSGLERIS